jgi:lysophospholipase L1-like esterase
MFNSGSDPADLLIDNPLLGSSAAGNVIARPNPTTGGMEFLSNSLSVAGKAGLNSKNIGTRIQFGRMGTISNATAKTYHVTAEAACHFDAIRPIFANNDSARSYQFAAVKVSALSSLATDADMLNNSGTWVSVTDVNVGIIPLSIPVSGAAGYRTAFTLPDFIKLSSLDRTDGGTLPLVAIRAYPNDTSATALPVYGNGTTDTAEAWASRDNRKWFARHFSGDGVTTPTNFTGGTSATPQLQSPIIGFQYLSRGTVVTVCGIGDSIVEGRPDTGILYGESYVHLACEAIQSAVPGMSVEYMQGGFSGESHANTAGNGLNGYSARALDILNNPAICPDVLVYQAGSPNDEVTTLSAAVLQDQFRALDRVVAECKKKGVALVLVNWVPTNYAAMARGSTDSLRVAYNATLAAKYKNVVDLSAIHTGPIDVNAQYTMLYTSDGVHQNAAGAALDAAALKTTLLSAIYGG